MRRNRTLWQSGTARGRVRTVSRTPNAGISLSKRRRWYADDEDTPEDVQSGTDDDGGEDGSDDSDDEVVPQSVDALPEWAQKLIRDGRSEAANYRAKLREIEDAKAEAERKQAEEQGEFKKLWEEAQPQLTELKALREKESARLEALSTRNSTRISELPKDTQATVQEIIETAGVSEDADKVSALLDKVIPTLETSTPAPDADGGAKGDGRNQSGAAKVKINRVSY